MEQIIRPSRREKTQVYRLDHPLVSVITPAFNEESIIAKNIGVLCSYLKGLEDRYDWELVIVNDGSKDRTGEIADRIAKNDPHIRVIHHKTNRNLGGALQTGFANVKGDFVVVMDLDLSYATDHIEQLLDECERTEADIVVASPYMKGGRCTAVPRSRLILSRVVNRIMRMMSQDNLHTYTSMVRVYRREFLKNLNLKSTSYAINPEILHKATILRSKIREIPAHLDWTEQQQSAGRTSSIRIYRGILSGMMSSFIFRPYALFMTTGILLLLLSTWVIGWIFWHTFEIYPLVDVPSGMFNDRLTESIARVFQQRPHAFFIGGLLLISAIQFLSLGFLSLQNKRYFDELFNINSTLLRKGNIDD